MSTPSVVENYRIDSVGWTIKFMWESTLQEWVTWAHIENTTSKVSRCLLVDPVSRLVINRRDIPDTIVDSLALDPKQEVWIFQLIPDSQSYHLANAIVIQFEEAMD